MNGTSEEIKKWKDELSKYSPCGRELEHPEKTHDRALQNILMLDALSCVLRLEIPKSVLEVENVLCKD